MIEDFSPPESVYDEWVDIRAIEVLDPLLPPPPPWATQMQRYVKPVDTSPPIGSRAVVVQSSVRYSGPNGVVTVTSARPEAGYWVGEPALPAEKTFSDGSQIYSVQLNAGEETLMSIVNYGESLVTIRAARGVPDLLDYAERVHSVNSLTE